MHSATQDLRRRISKSAGWKTFNYILFLWYLHRKFQKCISALRSKRLSFRRKLFGRHSSRDLIYSYEATLIEEYFTSETILSIADFLYSDDNSSTICRTSLLVEYFSFWETIVLRCVVFHILLYMAFCTCVIDYNLASYYILYYRGHRYLSPLCTTNILKVFMIYGDMHYIYKHHQYVMHCNA